MEPLATFGRGRLPSAIEASRCVPFSVGWRPPPGAPGAWPLVSKSGGLNLRTVSPTLLFLLSQNAQIGLVAVIDKHFETRG